MNRDTMIVFSRAGMGNAPVELQQMLAGIFLTLIGKDEPPGVVAFYGEGVKLTCEGSPVLDQLRALAAKETTLVICQTCLEFFGLRDRVQVGVVGGMGDIVAAMSFAGKVISV